MRHALLAGLFLFAAAISASANEIAVGGACTLDNAIRAANVGGAQGCAPGSTDPGVVDVITVPAGTYTLTSALPLISSSLTLRGAGAALTVIERAPGASTFRLLRTASQESMVVWLQLEGLTLRNGDAGTGSGGALLVQTGHRVSADDVRFENNVAGFGGAISDSTRWTGSQFVGGVLTIENSYFGGNRAEAGGAVFLSPGGSARVDQSTFDGNTAAQDGGALYLARDHGPNLPPVWQGASVEITNSTFKANNGQLGGGALVLYTERASASIVNSTLSGNRTDRSGGGIHLVAGTLTLNNVTITKNVAATGPGLAIGTGTGNATVTVGNSILSGNETINGIAADVFEAAPGSLASLGYNLISTEPGLAPLTNNGGPTETHALLPGSPAIDAGNNDACPDRDQRGKPRPDRAGLCDIGAFERHQTYRVVLRTSGGGSIVVEGLNRECPATSECELFIEAESTIVLRASRDEGLGMLFDGWSGPCVPIDPARPERCEATVDGEMTIGATFHEDANITLDVLSADPIHVGDPIEVRVTVTRSEYTGTPQGSVTLTVDGANPLPAELVNGETSATLTNVPAGAHDIKAQYSTRYTARTVTVLKRLTTIRLQSTPNPSLPSDTVTFTATVTPLVSGPHPPRGIVVLSRQSLAVISQGPLDPVAGGTSAVATIAVSGSSLPLGTREVHAVYVPGDGAPETGGTARNDEGMHEWSETSADHTKLIPTTTLLTTAPDASRRGELVTLTARITAVTGPPTGWVTFTGPNGVIDLKQVFAGVSSTVDVTAQVAFQEFQRVNVRAEFLATGQYSGSADDDTHDVGVPLTVSKGPGGIVTVNGVPACSSNPAVPATCTVRVDPNTTVEVRTSQGQFIRWTGDCSTAPSSGCSLMVARTPRSVGAEFVYQLTTIRSGDLRGVIQVTPLGAILPFTCSGHTASCAYLFAPGRSVTLRALSPTPAVVFSHWESGCSTKSSSCTITMNGAITAKAVFKAAAQ